jgi:hypothetical protein
MATPIIEMSKVYVRCVEDTYFRKNKKELIPKAP